MVLSLGRWKRKIKLRSSRNKLVFFLVLVILSFCTLSLINFSKGEALDNLEDRDSYLLIVVKKGDTLWNIAKKYGPAQRDIREVVDDIKKVNNTKDKIFPGDILYIPKN